ncbi:MAG: T9SS type A sorting domain-containing protein, partial [bacterium]
GFAGMDSASYGDSVEFSSDTRFPFHYLRLCYALRSSSIYPRVATGLSGVAGFPSVSIDPAKVPASWNGALDKCWVFQERSDCIVIGVLTVSNPGQNPLEGRTAAHYYYSPDFRVTVFGIPLFFCHENEAQALFDVLLPTMLTAESFPNSAARIDEYGLNQNYPNPFNAMTEIAYELPKAGKASLRVFDILGREVATLVNGDIAAGSHRVMFDGSRLPSGIYFYRLQIGNFASTKKMLLLK